MRMNRKKSRLLIRTPNVNDERVSEPERKRPKLETSRRPLEAFAYSYMMVVVNTYMVRQHLYVQSDKCSIVLVCYQYKVCNVHIHQSYDVL